MNKKILSLLLSTALLLACLTGCGGKTGGASPDASGSGASASSASSSGPAGSSQADGSGGSSSAEASSGQDISAGQDASSSGAASSQDAQETTGEPTQEPAGQPAPESVNYREIYAAVLRGKGTGAFRLIWVDEDDIPELTYFAGNGSHLDQVALYTIYQGQAVYLDDLGAYGSLVYGERVNRIFGYTGMNENAELEKQYTYMIQDGTLVQAPDWDGYDRVSSAVQEAPQVTEENLQRLLNGELG